MPHIEEQSKPLVDNKPYKEKFQFLLSINEFIICQRYFKVNGFNSDSLGSEELKLALDEAVELIKKNLESKSRTYLWYNAYRKIKLTGFTEDAEEATFYVPQASEMDAKDVDRPKEGEYVLKFQLLVDDMPYYTRCWDANVYPKYVRNNIDLTNSNEEYRGKDPQYLSLNQLMIRDMTIGKRDVGYTIIKKLCEVMSNNLDENKKPIPKQYTINVHYGARTYPFVNKSQNVIAAWEEEVKTKTNQYMAYATNYMSDKLFNRIEQNV